MQAGQRAGGQAVAGARHQALVLEQGDDARRALQDLDRRDDDQLQHRRRIGDRGGDLGRARWVSSVYGVRDLMLSFAVAPMWRTYVICVLIGLLLATRLSSVAAAPDAGEPVADRPAAPARRRR